jgi:uncharacterized protein YcnI
MKTALSIASLALLAAAAPAWAHVTLATPQAVAGSYFKAVFNVPHGCKGSPTIRLRIRIPDGVISVKPQPKPGWQLEVVEGPYSKTYSLHGAQVSSGVREISWTGRLPDAYFDDFAFMSYLSPDLPAGSVVHFPVVQECEKGVSRWIDVTEPSDTPAPRLTLIPKP